MKLVNDESQVSGCYCTDSELRSILTVLRETPATATTLSLPTSADEVLRFALETGFGGDEAEWSEAYAALCGDTKQAVNEGLSLDAFRTLVNDRCEDSSCFCTDEELGAILERLKLPEQDSTLQSDFFVPSAESQSPLPGEPDSEVFSSSPPFVSRKDLVQAMFHMFDLDGDDQLNESEMRRLAEEKGFQGDTDAWKEAFSALCKENGRSIEDGVDDHLFADVVNGKSKDPGCYCTDEELLNMFNKFDAAAEVVWLGSSAQLNANDQTSGRSANSTAGHLPSKQLAVPASSQFDQDLGGLSGHEDDSETNLMAAAAVRRAVPEGPQSEETETNLQAAIGDQTMRTEIIRAVFIACDTDNDGCLNRQEMWKFALETGFEGNDMEWDEAFRALCPESVRNQNAGIEFTDFAVLVEDNSEENGCYSTNEELLSMLRTWATHAGSRKVSANAKVEETEVVATREQHLKRSSGPQRADLLRSVFHQLDVDRDGVLNQEEMRHFAVETGFKGSDHQWAETYDALCGSWRNPHDGVDLDLFFRFVDDFSEDSDCYLTDDELLSLQSKLNLERANRKASLTCRNEVVTAVYEALCVENGIDVDFGLDCNTFTMLVEASDAGCICTDQELATIQRRLRSRAVPRPATKNIEFGLEPDRLPGARSMSWLPLS